MFPQRIIGHAWRCSHSLQVARALCNLSREQPVALALLRHNAQPALLAATRATEPQELPAAASSSSSYAASIAVAEAETEAETEDEDEDEDEAEAKAEAEAEAAEAPGEDAQTAQTARTVQTMRAVQTASYAELTLTNLNTAWRLETQQACTSTVNGYSLLSCIGSQTCPAKRDS